MSKRHATYDKISSKPEQGSFWECFTQLKQASPTAAFRTDSHHGRAEITTFVRGLRNAMLITTLLGILLGVLLGTCGAGGGLLAVPMLILGAGLSPHEAVPISLIAICMGASAGALDGFRRHEVRYRAALLVAACSLPFSLAGLATGRHLPHTLLQALLLLILGGTLWQQVWLSEQAERREARPVCHVDRHSGRFIWNRSTTVTMSTLGSVMGFTSGLLGVGGGFIAVPWLRRYTALPPTSVFATSLFVIALTSFGGVMGAWASGQHPPAALTTSFSLGVLAGVVCGRLLSPHLREHHSRGLFALTLALAIVGLALHHA